MEPTRIPGIPGEGLEPLHCAVCMYSITATILGTKVILLHPKAMLLDGRWEDHLAVPELTTEETRVRGVCDFCGRPHPRWVYEYAPTTTVAVYEDSDGDTSTHTIENDSGWTACTRCSLMVDDRKWKLLFDTVSEEVRQLVEMTDEIHAEWRKETWSQLVVLELQGTVPKKIISVFL